MRRIYVVLTLLLGGCQTLSDTCQDHMAACIVTVVAAGICGGLAATNHSQPAKPIL